MRLNSVKTYKPAFKAQIEDDFLKTADNYYKKNSPQKYKQFCSAVRRFSEIPNTDNISISLGKIYKDGKILHALYASKIGTEEHVVLTAKDQIRKILDKFSYMNEYEFKLKMGMIKKED